MKILTILFASFFLLQPVVAANDTAASGNDPVFEQRYQTLIAELRCLVCQNQSLADSNADLAGDMRREVRGMMEQGRTNEQIVQFLVDRYGDFVRYRPPVKPATALLWFGPLILLAGGAMIAVVAVRRHQRLNRDTDLATSDTTDGGKG